MERLALGVVPLANLVPLARVALLAAAVAPALLPSLAPVLGAALGGGLAVAVLFLRRFEQGEAPVPESRNPAELSTALRFGAVYALVLLVSAWLSDLAGSRGLYAAALASGLVDIDPINLSALNFFAEQRIAAEVAVIAICLAYLSNVAFKMAVLVWYNRRLAWRALWPLAATLAAGGAALALA
jgi:uncharacterized membrane protein (DUF4010 family)